MGGTEGIPIDRTAAEGNCESPRLSPPRGGEWFRPSITASGWLLLVGSLGDDGADAFTLPPRAWARTSSCRGQQPMTDCAGALPPSDSAPRSWRAPKSARPEQPTETSGV